MISLGGLVNQKAFGKFEMGKVISNPFANAFIKEAEGEDHEVSMGQNQLDTIIKMATELKAKMGENEKEIPAWIQDHISKAENYISQAAGNYHEYGTNEYVNEEVKDWDVVHNVFVKFLKANTKELERRVLAKDADATKKAIKSIISGLTNAEKSLKLESVNEASPCWKGYKQVGMKDKNGRQVPNCVPNESVVNEAPNTGERIQNLNNRIKVLRDKISATKSPEQKKLFSDRLKNALQSLSNIKKDHSIKAPHRESVVKEAVAPKDMDKIKSAVEAASSFMGVGSELKKLGMKYTFATEPLAIYIVQPTPNNKVAIVNKRYVSKPDFVVGDIAVGVMEGVNEISSKTPKIFVKTAAVEKKIKELMDDRKKAVVPYNSEKDPKKKEILKQILIKLTKQIQGYEKNLVQLRDMEEEYLQQMHADAELDTTGL